MVQRQKFGAFLRGLRTEKLVGLRHAASVVGVSPGYLSRLERGDQDRPSSALLHRLGKLLETETEVMHARAGVLPDELHELVRTEEWIRFLLEARRRKANPRRLHLPRAKRQSKTKGKRSRGKA